MYRCSHNWSIKCLEVLVTPDEATKEVSKSEYAEEEYPTNCYGTFFILSGNVRDRLYQVNLIFIALSFNIIVKDWYELYIAGLH